MTDEVVVPPPKNKRRPRFTLEELEVLVDEIHRQKATLLGKFTDAQAAQIKSNAWRAIAAKISAVSNVGRTVDEIRRKWQDWASVVKQKEVSRKKSLRKTGGGIEEKPIVLTAIEEMVIAILGSTACEGIAGAIDSHLKQPPQKKLKVGDDVEAPPVCLQPPPTDVGLQLQATGTQGPMHRAEASKSIGQNAVVSESDEECTFVATPCRRARVTPTSGRTPPVGDASAEIVQIERERLVVEKERLGVEKERLGVEKERLHIDKCRLDVDKMKCCCRSRSTN